MDLFDSNHQIQLLFNTEQTKKPTTNQSKSKKKQPKQDYTTLMQQSPITPFKCKNHTTTSMHVHFRKQVKNPPACGSCGFKCEGKSGYISCPKKANCFNLCTVCRVCLKNHKLRMIKSLKNFEDKKAEYGQNKFKCEACNKAKKIGDSSPEQQKGVLVCLPCLYTVCLSCIQEYNQMWQRFITGDWKEFYENTGLKKAQTKEQTNKQQKEKQPQKPKAQSETVD